MAPRELRFLLLTTALAAGMTMLGCGPAGVGLVPVPGGGSGGTTIGGGTPTPGFGGGSGSQTAAPPPSLGGGGAGSPGGLQPPSSSLPPPLDAGQYAAELRQRHGVEVQGAGATVPNLEVIEASFEEYPRDHLQGLSSLNVPLYHGLQSLQGFWESWNGRTADITVYAQTGRSRQVHAHTVVHELAHHMSLLSHRSWGDRFEQALVRAPFAYPSEYSRTKPEEQVAENMAFALLGGDSERSPLPGWQVPSTARQLLAQEFGARVSIP